MEINDFKIENFRTSSSSIDDFFKKENITTPRIASGGRVRVSSLRQIEGAGFKFISSDKLVRISKKDFWRLGEDQDGSFIERLVSDDDGPVMD